jgi:hypothetical protein
MKQMMKLSLIAGAAMASPVLAQNASLDLDRAYAAELKADASGRSSLLQGGGTSGYTARGFTLSDGSGDNTMSIGGNVQFRYMHSFRSDDAPIGTDNGFTHGFQNNNIRLWAGGTVHSRDLAYRIQTLVDDSGAFTLEDAWARYTFGNNVSVMWGQFRLPFLREWNIASESQLAVERSELNTAFSPGYSQGVQVSWNNEQWRVMGGFTDGALTGNSPFNSAAEADWAFNGRVDFMFTGNDWAAFNQYTSWRSAQAFQGMVGAAFYFASMGNTNPAGAEGDEIGYTIDCSLLGPGWNAAAAFVGNTINDDTPGGIDTTDFGFNLQGGYFFDNQWEVFGRWTILLLDEDAIAPRGDGSTPDDTLNFFTVGVNYYISEESQAAKFTADVVFAANETDAFVDPTVGNTQTGLLGDVSSGEFDIRFQLSLKF